MSMRQRLGLIALMMMSLFAFAVSVVKTVMAMQSTQSTTDTSYTTSLGMLWGNLEQAIVIAMGCVPAIRGIVKLDFPRSVIDSLGSLLRLTTRSRSRTSQKSASPPTTRGAEYEDLELGYSGSNAGKWYSNTQPRITTVAAGAGEKKGSQTHLVGDSV